jgi:hypothetical protein
MTVTHPPVPAKTPRVVRHHHPERTLDIVTGIVEIAIFGIAAMLMVGCLVRGFWMTSW